MSFKPNGLPQKLLLVLVRQPLAWQACVPLMAALSGSIGSDANLGFILGTLFASPCGV